ncbi:hypothetical protein C8F01DRAFT_139387 [Mycena amicta]|nr:hypothetical protein C8F01DRAFT_139387 [Mycena amicta]
MNLPWRKTKHHEIPGRGGYGQDIISRPASAAPTTMTRHASAQEAVTVRRRVDSAGRPDDGRRSPYGVVAPRGGYDDEAAAEYAKLQRRAAPTPSPFQPIPERQPFGIVPNDISLGDVRRMMEGLGEEVFQIAAALSEHPVRGRSGHSRRNSTQQRVDVDLSNSLIPAIGSDLVSLLSASGDSRPPAPILLQIAIQAAVAQWGYWKIKAWAPVAKQSEVLEPFMTRLYADIQDAENPRDAARWRAMTRRQLGKRVSATEVRAALVQKIVDVLSLPRMELVERAKIEAAFGDRITESTRTILRISTAIGAEVISEELEPGLVPPGTPFDPATMDDMWDEEQFPNRRAETVVCTTTLGLCEKRSSKDGREYRVIVSKPKFCGLDYRRYSQYHFVLIPLSRIR